MQFQKECEKELKKKKTQTEEDKKRNYKKYKIWKIKKKEI